jgi:hypothetical protein
MKKFIYFLYFYLQLYCTDLVLGFFPTTPIWRYIYYADLTKPFNKSKLLLPVPPLQEVLAAWKLSVPPVLVPLYHVPQRLYEALELP